MELEGLRGLAALAVVLGHYFLIFYPVALSGVTQKTASLQHMGLEDNIYGNPFFFLYSGTFAVALFFVLSGFVLSIGFFQTKRVDIIKKLAIKRYLRLMLPALGSILIALLLIKLGLSFAGSAAEITGSPLLTRLANAWTLDPNLWTAIKDGVVGIFVTSGGSSFNSVLWTMSVEFVGSFIVFGFALLFAHSKYRWAGYTVLFAMTFNTWFMAFIIGMVMADLYSMGKIYARKTGLKMTALVAGALFLASYPLGNIHSSMYSFLRPKGVSDIKYEIIYLTIAAAVIVFAVISSKQLAGVLSKKRISVLGKYTFSVYLMHMAVLFTFSSGLFVYLVSIGVGYNKSALITFLVSIPVIWVVARWFERYIDAPSIRLARWFADVYEGKEELKLKQRLVVARETARFKWVVAKSRISSVFQSTEDPLE